MMTIWSTTADDERHRHGREVTPRRLADMLDAGEESVEMREATGLEMGPNRCPA